MRTREFTDTLRSMNCEVFTDFMKDSDGNNNRVIFVCKNDQNVVYVGEQKKWLMKNDYFGFNLLTAKEQDEIMKVVQEYIATELKDRQ